MLAVGSRVGTFVANGIYTVSGPFHPFGGAVDIIVVEQEDGTFKSSPWYVKFGKFQGVLKRRQKKVVVSVNDVDANFHMYLDHKGEAYFLKDDVTDDSLPQEIEDSAAPSPDDATSSAGENFGEPLAIEDSKEEEGQEAQADHEKEESEDERGDDLELRFEGRGSSRELLQQSVGNAVMLELELRSQVQESTVDDVCFPEALRDGKANREDTLSSSNFENLFSSDRCRMDRETETSGAVNHAFENQGVDVEGCQGSSICSALVANVGGDAFDVASPTKVGTLDESQELNRGGSGKNGQFIHGLLNKAVVLQELSSPGPSTAVLASATLESLSKVVSDTQSTQTSRHKYGPCKQVELWEDDAAVGIEVREADFQVTECINTNCTDNLSPTCVDNRSYADVVRTEIETETTSGTVIHALLNQAVGIEVSQSSPQSTVLVANAALEALTAASLPEVATSKETQVPDWESLSNAGKIIHGLLNKVIGLQASASSGPASALIAKAVLNSLSNVLSDGNSTPTSSNGSAEPRVVELSEEDIAAENEVSSAALSSDAAGSSVVETTETAIVPIPSETSSNDKLVFLVGGRQYPWTIAAPVVLGLLAFGQVRIAPARTGAAVSGEQPVVVATGEPASGTLTDTSSGGWRLWPFGRSARTPEQVNTSALLSRDSDALMIATDAAISSRLTKEYMRMNGYYKKPRKVRTNSPSSQQLASLGLKEGSNKITFTFFTRVLGKQQVDARIYLWKWNARIVISDVDGTITKSDVLGQVMPLVGKDWTQSGVAKLFSAIKKNGYELMFLSARAISQAHITRLFLEGIKQDGQHLPDGPVVISPDGLFPSLYREVIRRAPHEFKIACLEDIKSLFPPECKPFYAGFGNRDTDELSYLKVGISKGKIFIINPKGEVMVNNQVDIKSYTSLHKRVDDMFPAMTFTEQEDFNEWNFWKLPLPDIEDDDSVKSTGSSSSKRSS